MPACSGLGTEQLSSDLTFLGEPRLPILLLPCRTLWNNDRLRILLLLSMCMLLASLEQVQIATHLSPPIRHSLHLHLIMYAAEPAVSSIKRSHCALGGSSSAQWPFNACGRRNFSSSLLQHFLCGLPQLAHSRALFLRSLTRARDVMNSRNNQDTPMRGYFRIPIAHA